MCQQLIIYASLDKLYVVFGWTDLKGFIVQEDGFEWMKVVWLT